MEFLDLAVALVLIWVLMFVLRKQKKGKNFPPSPPSIPIISHLHLIKEPLHRALHELSAKYGDILFLQFGSRKGYKLIPFGVGRRSCPGAALGRRAMGLTLGALIQCFEWVRIGEEQIDMAEGVTRLSMPKAEPLEALCKPRQDMIDLLSTL